MYYKKQENNMSILDDDDKLLDDTNVMNFGFPSYDDWGINHRDPYSYSYARVHEYWWLTQYYGDSIIKEGICIVVHEHSEYLSAVLSEGGEPLSDFKELKSYWISIRIGGDDMIPEGQKFEYWINFIKIKDIFDTLEEARKAAYNILCFLKEYDHRDFFEVLCKRHKYYNGNYRIQRQFYVDEIYKYDQI